jgi:hypothetical protein
VTVVPAVTVIRFHQHSNMDWVQILNTPPGTGVSKSRKSQPNLPPLPAAAAAQKSSSRPKEQQPPPFYFNFHSIAACPQPPPLLLLPTTAPPPLPIRGPSRICMLSQRQYIVVPFTLLRLRIAPAAATHTPVCCRCALVQLDLSLICRDYLSNSPTPPYQPSCPSHKAAPSLFTATAHCPARITRHATSLHHDSAYSVLQYFLTSCITTGTGTI